MSLTDMGARARTSGRLRERLAALLERAIDACMPPGSHDPTFVRRARTAIGINCFAIPIFSLSALGQCFGFGNMGGAFGQWFPALNFGAALVMCATLVLLRRFALLTPSVCLVTAYFSAFHVLATYVTGGVRSPFAVCLLARRLALLLTAGRVAAVAWLGVVLSMLAGLHALHVSGHAFDLVVSKAEHDQFWLVCVTSLHVIVFAIVWAFDRARTV